VLNLHAVGNQEVADQPPVALPEQALRTHDRRALLRPGFGDYYEVTIEAVADPTPPRLPPPELAGDLRQKIERLLAQLQDVSEQEAMAQVYLRRRMTLCAPCCRRWIENPVG
jgi:hypothetical protein